MIDGAEVQCPHCGERILLLLDPSEGDHTRIEDCPVCCSPIVVTVTATLAGEPAVTVCRDNE